MNSTPLVCNECWPQKANWFEPCKHARIVYQNGYRTGRKEGIEEANKNRDYWREKYNGLSSMLVKLTPPNQEWEGPEKELEKLIAERLEEQG